MSTGVVNWADEFRLHALDASGYVLLHAIAAAPFHSPSMWSLSKPHPFECDDGHVYWCKGNTEGAPVQQGLSAELIGGRLAERLGVGGPCAIVEVDECITSSDGTAQHLTRVVVGSRHHEGMNARSWLPILGSNRLAIDLIDPVERAKVVAFQTWLGAEDAQVLVDFRERRLFSIDHGGCFAAMGGQLTNRIDIVATAIPGTDPDVGRRVDLVDQAVSQIESISDEDLLDVVSRVPDGPGWDAGAHRRLAIGAWLAHRRDHLRSTLCEWAIAKSG